MNFSFSEEQLALKTMARRFLETYSTPDKVRAVSATGRGYDPDVWRKMSQELGWPALVIPEKFGGLGLTAVEMSVVMEEMGRVLFCSPFFSSVVLAAHALLLGGNQAQKEEYLPGIAGGEVLATLALTETAGKWDATGIAATATPRKEGFSLSGIKTYIPDGHISDVMVVAARFPGSSGEEGISLFILPSETSGVRRRLLPTMDATRKQAEIALNDVCVTKESLIGEEGNGWPIVTHVLDRAAVCLAAEQVGVAEKCLEMAVEYAKIRVQFNRPIGTFQAIKHKCADMLLMVESARSASMYASWAAAEAPEELPLAASSAKAYCSRTAFHCAAENIQIHGGIGFTWEHPAHLYFKRAKSLETLLGDATWHSERVAKLICR